MAITSNTDLLVAFDEDQLIQSTRILEAARAEHEHCAQSIAIEMLREIKARVATPDDYNNMTTEEYDSAVAAAVERAKRLATTQVHLLTATEIVAAANLGGNFFEHGYVSLMAGIQAEDKVSFRRTDIE